LAAYIQDLKKVSLFICCLFLCNACFKDHSLNIPVYKIGIVSDPQYCDCPPNLQYDRFHSNSTEKLEVCIDHFNNEEIDFMISLGDIIEKNDESFDSILSVYNHSIAPNYFLLGNHDFYFLSDSTMSDLLNLYQMPDYYYSINKEGWRFIILDGTDLSVYSQQIRPEREAEFFELYNSIEGQPHQEGYNGGIGQVQLEWLENELEQSKRDDDKVIVFCHFPIYPDHTSYNLYNYKKVRTLLESYENVMAYVNGHFHEGRYDFHNNIHYLTMAGMVQSEDANSYGILEIYADSIKLFGHGLANNYAFEL